MTEVKDETSDPGARGAAYRRLLRIEGGAYIGLDDDGGAGGRERRQATEYVAGVTRWKRRLDFLLAQFYRGDYPEMEVGLKVILRIGLYDVLFLRTPDYAAVDEAVRLAKHEIRRGAGGLANGILRSIIRSKDRLPTPNSGDDADDMAVAHSHPTWFVRRWLARYGRSETEALLHWNNARPTYGVRINTLKTDVGIFRQRLDDLAIEWAPATYLPYFIVVPTVQPLLEHGLLRDGLCAVQDESAGLIGALFDPRPDERIIDLCAAPGGKALHSAARMKNSGRIVAVDVHEGRLRLVGHGARATGVEIVETLAADARKLGGKVIEQADRVLVDAPCSGLGVLSKRADLRWRRSPEDIIDLAALQDDLLDAAARLVRPGGVLVYGTCTIEPEENAQRVQAFMERHDDFRLTDAREGLPDEVVTPDGYYATFPPRHGMDGAFGARLKRIR